MKKLLLLVFFLLVVLSCQGQFTIDGQFRTRGEIRNGYRELASDMSYGTPLVSQRSRITLNYIESNFLFLFSAQDARVWGQSWNNMPNNTIHVHEAWAAYKPSDSFVLKLGRQELKYDDQRIMAYRNFSTTGVTYDAALLVYTNSDLGFTTHLGSMINNLNDTRFLNYYPNSSKYMTFVWGEKVVAEGLKVNFLNFFDLSQNSADPHIMYGRNTVGANIIYSASSSYGGRLGAYYQFGNHWMKFGGFMGEQHVKVSAYSYNATAWVKPINNLKVSASVDTYSGNDWSSNSETFTAFNRLLAAGHAHMGFMDYFTSMDLNEVNWTGLHDFFIRAELIPFPALNLQATVHYFMLNKAFFPHPLLGSYLVNRNLGSEVDLVATYKLNSMLSIETAFVTIFPSETLKLVKLNGNNHEFSFFTYISLLFTPRFFEWNRPSNFE